MNTTKIVALLLIVAGALGLAYGGFSYMQTTHTADIGPMHMQINEKQTVNVPLWLSIGALAGGLVLLVTARKS